MVWVDAGERVRERSEAEPWGVLPSLRYFLGTVQVAPRARIVVADDDEIIRQLLLRALPKMGFEVITVADGRLARERLANETFDVLVTDIGMPEVGGMELIRWTRATCPEVRIIAITGLDTPELVTACLELGATRCLTKPFSIDALVRAIDLVVAR